MFLFLEVIQHLEYAVSAERPSHFRKRNHLEPWHVVSNEYIWILR